MAKLIPDSNIVIFNPGDTVSHTFLNNLQVLAYGGINDLDEKVLVKDGSVLLDEIYVPTEPRGLVNKGYVDSLIQSGVILKGSVDTYLDLPAGLGTEDTGDTYIVLDGSENPAPYENVPNVAYRWDGTVWIGLGPIFEVPVQDGTVPSGLQLLANYNLVNTNQDNIADIISGAQIVGLADKANKDGNSNDIVTTYATKTELSNALADLAGVGRTTETVKGNADDITALQNSVGNLTFLSFPDTPSEYDGFGRFNVNVNEAEDALIFSRPNNNSSTGVISGCLITGIPGGTTFDISAGTVAYVDSSQPNFPSTTVVDFPGQTGITIDNLLTAEVTYVSLAYDLGLETFSISQRTSEPDALTRRQEVSLGQLFHFDKTVLFSAQSAPIVIPQPLHQTRDYHPIVTKKEGLVFQGVPAQQQFLRGAGSLVGSGINYDIEPLNPNVRAVPQESPNTFIRIYRDGAGGVTADAPTTTFNPNQYDDGSGTPQPIPNPNNATNHYIYVGFKGVTFVILGQNVYSTLSAAVDARVNGTDVISGIPSEILKNAVLASIVSMDKTATDFSNSNDVVFFTVTGEGGSTGGGGSVGAVTDNNVSISSVFENIAGATQKLLNENIDKEFWGNRLIDLTWDNVGKVYKTVNSYPFLTGSVATFRYLSTSDDPDEPVEISLDDGVTTYALFKEDGVTAITVKEVEGDIRKTYREGVAAFVEQADAVVKTLPYNGVFGQWRIPANNLATDLAYAGPSPVKNSDGRTLSQIATNPLFKQGTTDWSFTLASGSVTNQILSFTATGSGGFVGQESQVVSEGTVVYCEAMVKADSTSVILQIFDGVSSSSASHSGSGEYEKLSFFHTISANPLFTRAAVKDNRASAWTQVDIEYINTIIAPTDISTVAEMEALLSAPLDFGTYNVGSEREFFQELDNRNEFGNYSRLDSLVDTTTEQSGVPYKRSDSTDINEVNLNWIGNTTYTILTHVLNNDLQFEYVTVLGTNIDSSNVSISAGKTGVFKQLFTTGSSPLTTNKETGNGGTGDNFTFRTVILEGDHTNISDEEALRIIKQEDYGTFTRQGVTIQSNGKNNFNYAQTYDDTDNVITEYIENGITVVSTSTAGNNNNVTELIQLNPNTVYTLSCVSSILSGTSNPSISVLDENDSTLNFQTLEGTMDIEFTTPANGIIKIWFYANRSTAEIAQMQYSNIQLEIGTTATAYVEYKNPSYAYNPTEKAGLYNDLEDVFSADDDEFQRFNIDNGDGFKNSVNTDWFTTGALTNTVIYSLTPTPTVYPELRVSGVLSTTVSPYAIQIGNDIFTVVSQNDAVTNDVENTTYIATNGTIRFRVNSTTYPTREDWLAHLQVSDIKFIYLRETPLPRTEAQYQNESEWSGQLFVHPRGTYQVSSSSGVVLSEFKALVNYNRAGQVEVLVDAVIELIRDVYGLEATVEQVVDAVNTLAGEIGYLNDLNTTDKSNLVNAVNETLTRISNIAVGTQTIYTFENTGSASQALQTQAGGYTAISAYDLIMIQVGNVNIDDAHTSDGLYAIESTIVRPADLYSVDDQYWKGISDPGSYDYDVSGPGFTVADLPDPDTLNLGDTGRVEDTDFPGNYTYFEVDAYDINAVATVRHETINVPGAENSQSLSLARSVVSREGADLKYALAGQSDPNQKIQMKIFGIKTV